MYESVSLMEKGGEEQENEDLNLSDQRAQIIQIKPRVF